MTPVACCLADQAKYDPVSGLKAANLELAPSRDNAYDPLRAVLSAFKGLQPPASEPPQWDPVSGLKAAAASSAGPEDSKYDMLPDLFRAAERGGKARRPRKSKYDPVPSLLKTAKKTLPEGSAIQKRSDAAGNAFWRALRWRPQQTATQPPASTSAGAAPTGAPAQNSTGATEQVSASPFQRFKFWGDSVPAAAAPADPSSATPFQAQLQAAKPPPSSAVTAPQSPVRPLDAQAQHNGAGNGREGGKGAEVVRGNVSKQALKAVESLFEVADHVGGGPAAKVCPHVIASPAVWHHHDAELASRGGGHLQRVRYRSRNY